jgi:hypothetical protein
MMGFASAEATYKNENDDKEIELNILIVRERRSRCLLAQLLDKNEYAIRK